MARTRSVGERLGARLRAKRASKAWSQEALAEKVGLGANYIGQIERAVKLPTIETLVALAKALGCSPAELLDDAMVKDGWVDEVVAVAASVPKGRRELVLAVLKTMATAAG